jgi:hypothetical protein
MSIFDQSAQNIGQAGATYGQMANGNPIAESMNAYINPWQNQVMNDVSGRMREDRDMQLGQVGDNADAAGAFGGSRHGIVEGEVYNNSQQNIGEMMNQMAQQGFNTAGQFAGQDRQLNMQGAQGLQNLGSQQFNMGNQLNSNMMNNGSMQQSMLQSILGGADQQYGQYMDSPNSALNVLLAAMTGSPMNNAGQTTSQYNPGTMDYAGLGLQLAGAGMGVGGGPGGATSKPWWFG